jgi:hypothetical protein
VAVEEASADVCQEILLRSMALRITSSLRMHAVRADLGYFPRARKLDVKVLDDWIGTNRGDHGHIQDAPDLGARPPQIQRLPRKLPLSRLKGASPTSAAICLRLSAPSSGKRASRVVESTFPTPGHRAQQLVALAPDRGLADQTGEFVVEPGEPLFQPADVLIKAFVDHLRQIGPAILFRREHLSLCVANY